MLTWPHYDDEQIAAVTRVLSSGKVNAWTGTDVADFEADYRAYTGATHAIAMANGSVTLDAALMALGVGPGDEVIVTPRSFVASASCVLLRGATPVFADVDRDTQNITPETVAPLITPRTKGILPVHLAGWPCDMEGFRDLADMHGLWILEDCAQAHGAMIGEQHVGTFGDIASFSFCQDKILTTGGEGGLVTTNRDDLFEIIWSFKDHGKSRERVFATDHPPGFRWLHESGPGTNLRMTGVQAALGRLQLARLDAWRGHRTRLAHHFAEKLSTCAAFRVPMPDETVTHAFYRFYAFARPEALAEGRTAARIIAEASGDGFPVFSGSCSEIYREKTFSDRGIGPKEPLPVARELGETSIACLVDPTWDLERVDMLANRLVAAGNAALR